MLCQAMSDVMVVVFRSSIRKSCQDCGVLECLRQEQVS